MGALVVNTGLAKLIARLKGSDNLEPNYSAIGTGAGTTAAADTTLFTEAGTRVQGTSSIQQTTVAGDTYQVVATHSPGTAETITNAGLFDASSAGNLFMKGDFAGIALGAQDSLQLTYQVTAS